MKTKHKKLEIMIVDCPCKKEVYLNVFNENNEIMNGLTAALNIKHLNLDSLGCSLDIKDITTEDMLFINDKKYKLLDLVHLMEEEITICLDKQRNLYLCKTLSTLGDSTVIIHSLNSREVEILFYYNVVV